MWEEIERSISAAVGRSFQALRRSAVGGGCINETVHLCGREQSFFVKLNAPDRLPMFTAEAAGLAAIRASASVRAPEPIVSGSNNEASWLVLEYIETGPKERHSGARLGEQLALMHACKAQRFGWERDNTIGTTPQHNDWSTDWTKFLGTHRLGFQLRLTATNGVAGKLLDKGERLLGLLPHFFESYQPVPSLLHGDLWGGNWTSDRAGDPVLFDPAVYYGDRETDLAMTELFGGFDQAFYQAYNAAWPLNPGYRVRRPLYQLYHVLNHFNLFGGGYARQAEGLIDSLLAEV